MSLPEYVMLAVALLVGGPSFLRVEAGRRRVRLVNLTAFGLLFSYGTAQSLWYFTGWGHAMLSDPVYRVAAWLALDTVVIGAIYCKPPTFDCYPYRSLKHQLAALWLERSYWDRVILAIFPFLWTIYVLPMSEATRWWGMYWLMLAQFLAAGGEAAEIYRSRRAANAVETEPDNPSSGAKLSWAAAGMRGYG